MSRSPLIGPVVAAWVLSAQACGGGASNPGSVVAPPARAQPTSPSLPAASPSATTATTPSPPPDRLVAVGDLHADLPQALAIFGQLGLVDAGGHWVGGKTVLVQTGDLTDRGPDSLEVIRLLDQLEEEAAAAGGRVVVLLGNHEVMNLQGDVRYVSLGDVTDFGSMEARVQAFSAQGELGSWLREKPAVARVGRTIFVHGGVSATFAPRGVDALNAAVRAGIDGGSDPVLGSEGPLWYRGYLLADESVACAEARFALDALGADRMVMGHTTQRSGSLAVRCGGRLIGIDVGISSHYGGHLAALELRGGDAWAWTPAGPVDLPDPP